jgi:hypothetical protein
MTKRHRDQELVGVNQAMLESVAQGDWSTVAQYCREDLSCFEAVTEDQLVDGPTFKHSNSNSRSIRAALQRLLAPCPWCGRTCAG